MSGPPIRSGGWPLTPRDGWAYPAAMLPDGFQWVRRYEHAPPGEVALMCDGWYAAHLTRKVSGEWYAVLHLSSEPLGAYRIRDCASRESGLAGVKAWACRHEAKLREQAALYRARLPRR